jgi:hypothetical protein
VNVYLIEDDPLTLVEAGPNWAPRSTGSARHRRAGALARGHRDGDQQASAHRPPRPRLARGSTLGAVAAIDAAAVRGRATRPKPPRTSSSLSTPRRRERHWAWRTPRDLSDFPRSPSQPLHDVVRCPLGQSGHAGETTRQWFLRSVRMLVDRAAAVYELTQASSPSSGRSSRRERVAKGADGLQRGRLPAHALREHLVGLAFELDPAGVPGRDRGHGRGTGRDSLGYSRPRLAVAR